MRHPNTQTLQYETPVQRANGGRHLHIFSALALVFFIISPVSFYLQFAELKMHHRSRSTCFAYNSFPAKRIKENTYSIQEFLPQNVTNYSIKKLQQRTS